MESENYWWNRLREEAIEGNELQKENAKLRKALKKCAENAKWLRSKLCAYGPNAKFCDCKFVKHYEDNPQSYYRPQVFDREGEHNGCPECREIEFWVQEALK
jgi:hypothetical protein